MKEFLNEIAPQLLIIAALAAGFCLELADFTMVVSLPHPRKFNMDRIKEVSDKT